MRVARASLFAVALATVISCESGEPPTYPTSGRVVLQNGQPVQAGSIEFSPVEGGSAARGRIESDGRFTLTTGNRAGAIAGAHRIVIVQMTLGDVPASHAVKHRTSIVHKKYARFESSGLNRTVEPGDNDFLITVDSAE